MQENENEKVTDKNGGANRALSLKRRIRRIIELSSEGLVDRQDAVRALVLATLCGMNTFLYGPPGTAKSLLSRRMRDIFAGKTVYYEHLMHRFSTPDELFGPISITKLKQDVYERSVAGYLAEADVAFLDEIWKSSPAVLNTLLTLINEHTYHNGNRILNVPLRSLVAASNEIPDGDDDLAPLYDRFIVRLTVGQVRGQDNFKTLVVNAPACERDEPGHAERMSPLAVTDAEYREWREKIAEIPLSDELLDALASLREKFIAANARRLETEKKLRDYDGFSETEAPGAGVSYVSDRRWVQCANYLRAAAFFNEDKRSTLKNLIHLEDLLWRRPEEKPAVREMILEEIASTLHRRLEAADEGKILANGAAITKTVALLENGRLFLDHNVRVCTDAAGKTYFRLLKDFGFTYIRSADYWNLDGWYKKIDPSEFYKSEVASSCRNAAREGKTSVLIPEIGSVIRIILHRDLAGYFTKGDLGGTEVFTYTIPGLRQANGQTSDDEKYTAKSSMLPKAVQLFLKNRLEDTFELYARVAEIHSQLGGLDKVLKSTIKIGFENIFSDKCLALENHGADTAAIKQIVPLKGPELEAALPGAFMKVPETDNYLCVMENFDEVILILPHGKYPPVKGEPLAYEKRFNGRKYVWVEKECYRKWFARRAEELKLRNSAIVNCRLAKSGDLFLGELHGVINDGETVNPEKPRMRIQTVDFERAVIEVSSAEKPDITGSYIPYAEFTRNGTFAVLDRNGIESGEGAARDAPNGRALQVKLKSGFTLSSFVSNDISSFLDGVVNSFDRLRNLIAGNRTLMRDVGTRLERQRELINSDIFLSDDHKHDLTLMAEKIYGPITAELAKEPLYESKVNALLDKYLLKPKTPA